MESITKDSGSHDASLGREVQMDHHGEQYLRYPNSRGNTNNNTNYNTNYNTQQNKKAAGGGGGRGSGGRDRGGGRAGNQHYHRASLNTVSKWLSYVGNEGTKITSVKENSGPSNVVEAIGVINDTTTQSVNNTRVHTYVNVQTTKDEHHNTMGVTEPGNQGNNPTQTENNSTERTNISHQDQNEDADPTANCTSFQISIEFRTLQSNLSHHEMIAANHHAFLQQL
jgi:hypothetical protein